MRQNQWKKGVRTTRCNCSGSIFVCCTCRCSLVSVSDVTGMLDEIESGRLRGVERLSPRSDDLNGSKRNHTTTPSNSRNSDTWYLLTLNNASKLHIVPTKPSQKLFLQKSMEQRSRNVSMFCLCARRRSCTNKEKGSDRT